MQVQQHCEFHTDRPGSQAWASLAAKHVASHRATMPAHHNSSIQKNLISFSASPVGTLLVQSMTSLKWQKNDYSGPIFPRVFSGTGVWPHYCSICEGHPSRLLSVPVSGTSTEKAVTRTHPASAVSQDLGPIRCTPPCTDTHTHKDRLSTTVSKLAHQCEAALTTSVRAPHQYK